MKEKNICFELFKTFFKIGGFTIGGGYVMLPMIQHEVVDVRKWATEEEISNYYALGQSVPGIIAINTATMIGYKKNSIKGAIFATAGMVTPSLIIIMIIAKFFAQFQEYALVQSGFRGIRAAVVATITMAVIRLGKKTIKGYFGIILAIVAFVIVGILKISPIYVIVGAIILGLIKGGFTNAK